MAKIVIFGWAGVGKSTIASLIAKKLGYRHISSGELFRAEAAARGLDLYEFEKLCNGDAQYDMALDNRVATIGQTEDDFVIDSRLAWHFIPQAIKIKLNCDWGERTKRIAERDGVSLAEAEAKTKFREDSIIKRYRDYYGIEDMAPDRLFNLVVDTTHLTIPEVVQTVENFLEKEFGGSINGNL